MIPVFAVGTTVSQTGSSREKAGSACRAAAGRRSASDGGEAPDKPYRSGASVPGGCSLSLSLLDQWKYLHKRSNQERRVRVSGWLSDSNA